MLEYIAIAILLSCIIVFIRGKFGEDIFAFFQTEAGGRIIKYGPLLLLILGAVVLGYFVFTGSAVQNWISLFG